MAGLNSKILEAIGKSVPVGIVVIDKEDEKVVYLNARGKDLLGFDPSKLSFKDYALKIAKARKLENGAYLYEQLPLVKALQTGKTTRNQEVVIERPDKTKVHLMVNAAPLIDEKGKIVSALATFEDVSEFRRTEEALRKSNRKVVELIESLHEPFFEINRDWVITHVNKSAANILGLDSKDLIGEQFWVKFDYLVGTSAEENYHAAMEKKETRFLEREDVNCGKWYADRVFPTVDGIVILSVDITDRRNLQKKLEDNTKNLERLLEERTKEVLEGERVYKELYESFDEAFIAADWDLNVIHWNKAAERITKISGRDALGKKIYDVLPEMNLVNIEPYLEALQSGKQTRFMMNAVSRQTGKPSLFEISSYPSSRGIIVIVEDKTEEEQIKRLSTIGQVAGMVGHDIRNPLQSIASDVYLIKSDFSLMPEGKMKENLKESMLDIEKNVEYINKIVQDLQDYAKPIAPNIKEIDFKEIFKEVLLKKAIPENIKVSSNVETDIGRVFSDPAMLKRIFANLINNAVQAMPQGGKLTINAFREIGEIVVTVADTGQGIPEDIKPKLFTPLFTTKSKGQGFGLAAIKRLTEALGGNVSFESEVGKGTKFTIRLPKKTER